MVAVYYPPRIVSAPLGPGGDPTPLYELVGRSGVVVTRDTDNPAIITEDRAGAFTIPDGVLTVTDRVMLSGFYSQEGLTQLDFVSGDYRVPVWSPEGLEGSARQMAASAQAMAQDVEAARQAAEDAAAGASAPTDEAMATHVANPESQTRAALTRTAARPVGQGEQVFSVRDDVFGAVGDGTTDDTAALQACIDAVEAASATVAPYGAGVRLHFAPGTYRSDPLRIDASTITITGDGAVLLSTNQGDGVHNTGQQPGSLTITGSFIQVYGLTIDHVTRSDPSQHIKNGYAVGLRVRGTTDIHQEWGQYARIRDVKVIGSWYHGIEGRFMHSMSVESCFIWRDLATGIFVTDCHDVVLRDNTVWDSRDDLIFVGGSTPSGFEGNACTKVSILGNNLAEGREKGIGTSGVIGGTILANHIRDTFTSAIRLYENAADNLGPSNKIVVAANTIENAGQFWGVGKGTGPSSVAVGIHLATGATDVICSDNVIDNTYDRAILATDANSGSGKRRIKLVDNLIRGAREGIFLGSGSSIDRRTVATFDVRGNTIQDTRGDAIGLYGCTGGKVADNLIRTWGLSDSGVNRAIFVTNSDMIVISDNMGVNDAVSASSKQFVTVHASATNVVQRNNDNFAPVA